LTDVVRCSNIKESRERRKMKAIRISNEAYDFLVQIAKSEHRSLISTLDLFVKIFKESQDEELEEKGLSLTDKRETSNKIKTLAKSKKKSI
jgi:replication-associated recombination protein RarA